MKYEIKRDLLAQQNHIVFLHPNPYLLTKIVTANKWFGR